MTKFREYSMFILPKGMFFMPFAAIFFMMQVSHAKTETPAEISKSCIKAYPLAAGDTNAELIELYTQLCDKKNKQNVEQLTDFKIAIAQNYQEHGNNLKALQALNQLRSLNINTPKMTDIEFLAGTSISQHALNQMRSVELRPISESNYQPAKELAEAIRYAQPVISTKKETEYSEPLLKKRSAKKTSASSTNSGSKKQKPDSEKNTAPKSLKTANAAVPTKEPILKASAASNASPFDAFNKK
jgi:hypothetical protein